jgi:hypothetical protein
MAGVEKQTKHKTAIKTQTTMWQPQKIFSPHKERKQKKTTDFFFPNFLSNLIFCSFNPSEQSSIFLEFNLNHQKWSLAISCRCFVSLPDAFSPNYAVLTFG